MKRHLMKFAILVPVFIFLFGSNNLYSNEKYEYVNYLITLKKGTIEDTKEQIAVKVKGKIDKSLIFEGFPELFVVKIEKINEGDLDKVGKILDNIPEIESWIIDSTSPPKYVVHPLYYIDTLKIITDDKTVSLIDKEYSKYYEIKESDEVLCKLKKEDFIKIYVIGHSPQQGYLWDKKGIRKENTSIYIEIYKKSVPMALYPDAIEDYEETFNIGNLVPGEYDIFLCEKKIGKIVIE